jgi:hypothetical protein
LLYLQHGPGGVIDFWDRLADILRRDLFASENKPTVDDVDDVGTIFTAIVPIVQFGNGANQVSHALRHLREAGMTEDQIIDVQAAIKNDLPAVSGQMIPGKLTIRTITVHGVDVTYNAMKLPNGVINVGRVTLP